MWKKYNNFENITLGLPRIKEVRAIKGQKSDKSVKSKYRKRGDKWEGRVRIKGEQYSLYDIDERRLDLRIETVKDNYEKLLQIEEQYKSFVGTIEILNEKYNEELFANAKKLYNILVDAIEETKYKLYEAVNKTYMSINNMYARFRAFVPKKYKYTRKKVKEWFYEWLWNYKRFKAGGTFKGYVSKTKNHIIKNIGDKYLDEVTREDIQNIINNMVEKKYKSSTIKQVYLLLNEGFEQAVKSRYLEETPTVDIDRPKLENNIMEAVDIDVEKKLIDIFKNDEMCYPFAVLIDTGLRTSELCRYKMGKC